MNIMSNFNLNSTLVKKVTTLIVRKTSHLKMISSPYCALSRVCLHFLFCFIQDITKFNILQLPVLTWSKFKVSCQAQLWIHSFVLRSFSCHLMKLLHSCKSQWGRWEKNLKTSKIKYVVHNEKYHFSFRQVRHKNIKVLRLRSTDWKLRTYSG